MTIASYPPVVTTPTELSSRLELDAHGILNAAGLCELSGCTLDELASIQHSWNDLPSDNFLKDGGRYRQRRHSSFIVTTEQVRLVPHRPHYQPLEYNALHGGMLRLFEPVDANTIAQPVWNKLLQAIARTCSEVKGERLWYVEAHQFRIDTRNGIGRPTPEGAHRDGVDFVAILLVARNSVSGGESRLFEAEGRFGQRFTLSEPWTLLLLDDQKVIHESTPIQPTALGGYRDTLVLTYRSEGFLEPKKVGTQSGCPKQEEKYESHQLP
ncbi:2OG-Fe dioxygenase family protein [Ferriphaselus sp. R-1]|uniref:2OG-Fe dioxygenase family protein n=1 Tax=Ferriphaselus sp. R-1 TaxID=1485544 RepID=UPI0009DF523A|nr:2OG-Fe dioxygenase family protein [Ferriphaselus sp. R-1]